MKSLGYAASLLLLTAGVTILPPPAGAAPAPASSRTPAQELREDARGTVSVTREPATDQLGFVRTGPQGDLLGDVEAAPATKADEYLDRHGDAFGAPAEQLVRQSVETDEVGTTVTYTQEYRGIPVWGAMLKANLSPEGDLRSVNGAVVPDLDLPVVPALDAAEAGRRAVALVRADPPGDDKKSTEGLDSLEAGATELVVYREGLMRGEPGESSLAYTVEVTNGANIAEMVILSASKGTLLNRYSLGHGAVGASAAPVPSIIGNPPTSSTAAEHERVVDATTDTYWFFRNAFDRKSYDDRGSTMTYTLGVRGSQCRPGDVQWFAQVVRLCTEMTSDDIVAHEWTHAYTEYTHDLVYQWQSGALNEAYADIFGETIDLINARDDDAEGRPTTRRAIGACPATTAETVGLTILAPQTIAGPCQTGLASFGAPLDAAGVTGDVVLASEEPVVEEPVEPVEPVEPLAEEPLAEPAVPGPPADACEPLTNGAQMLGRIALVDEGECAPSVQALHAQEAGATAVIIGSSGVSTLIEGASEPEIVIPAVKITRADRDKIVDTLRAATPEPVFVTLSDTRSRRWLIGEKSPGFGSSTAEQHALRGVRDMWNPACARYADPSSGAVRTYPDRVRDVDYFCDDADNGGVHVNSSIPAHGFTLVADGGTSNNVTVPGIGLTKAAHIYYRALDQFQTPTSDFADHAEALDAACMSLVDAPLTALSTSPADRVTSSEVVTSTDCNAVRSMAVALELLKEPAQCTFATLLDPDAPSPCTTGRKVLWSDNFGQGISDTRWTRYPLPPSSRSRVVWETRNPLPGGRAGVAAYAADPHEGTCVEGSPSWRGRGTLTTQQIPLPASSPGLARLTFDHYVATESDYDGGNVKVRVGTGPFRVVPDTAYLFNGPNTTLAASANPLAAEQAFSGTDEGGRGSWVESQIDLGKVGAQPGDSIQVRFDFGRDACDGVDGWYVDDVEISVCGTAATVSTVGPGRSTYARQASLRVTTSGSDGAPYGTVQVRTETGQLLSESQPFSGTATLPLDRLLPARQTPYALTVRYLGSPLYAETESRHQLRVVKAPSKTTLSLRPRRVKQGAPVRARVRVTAIGFRPAGRVVLRAKGRIVGRATVKRARTSVVRITRALPPGRHQVVARYAGNANTKPSTKRVVLRVVRR